MLMNPRDFGMSWRDYLVNLINCTLDGCHHRGEICLHHLELCRHLELWQPTQHKRLMSAEGLV
jgi:hypothetical protein